MKKKTLYTTTIIAAAMVLPITASAAQITVSPGDTLYGLATKYNTSVENIRNWNQLSTNTIAVGQTLTVSQSESATIVNAEWLNVRAGAGEGYYVKATIKGGTKVQVLGQSGTWSQIQVSGVTGYVSTYYLKKETVSVQSNVAYITQNSGLFKSPGTGRVSTIAPQRVTVIERGADGWIKINTWLGALWVKNGVTAEAAQVQYAYITQTSGLFREIGKDRVSSLSPQRVTVVENGADGWMKINTWLGAMWVKNGVTVEQAQTQYTTITQTSGLFKSPGTDKVSAISPQRVVLLETGSNGWMKINTWLGALWVKNGFVEEEKVALPAPTAPATEVIYVVVAGDNLTNIALRYKTTVSNIVNYNGLKTTSLQVGQKLKIPSSAPASVKIFNMPVEGSVQMTSGFGPRWGTHHYGTDFSRWGDVKILAAADGIVSRSESHASFGEVIYIKHTIDGKNYETLYAHMRESSRAVKAGDRVTAGQFIGWMGSTGRSTGQHLHFEVHLEKYTYLQGSAVDPMLYLK